MARQKEHSHITINLNPRIKKSLQSVFFKWAITAGKFIIIGTEVIAMSALLYRFTIDRQIVDLHDEIARVQLFIDAQQSKEEEYRSIQTRLDNIKRTTEEMEIRREIMNAVLDASNQGRFETTNFTVNQNRISFDGTSPSIFDINNFIEELKTNENVVSIGIDEVSSVSQGVKFKLNIDVVEKS